MRAIAIDFAPASGRISLAMALVFAVGLVAAGLAANEAWEATDRAALFEQQVAERTAKTRSLPESHRLLPEKEIDAINRAIAELNTPWGQLFATLDAERYQRAALLSLIPNPRSGHLQILAETKTVDDMADFVRSLQGEAVFSDAALEFHELNAQDPNRPTRFGVDATWRLR